MDGDAGYTLVEAVIIVPVIIVLTMLVVQSALVWHGRHVAQAAAQAAARSAGHYLAGDAAGRADGAAYLGQVAPTLLSQPSVSLVRGPRTVTATVRATVLSVVPFGDFTVDESAAAPIEAFTGPGAP